MEKEEKPILDNSFKEKIEQNNEEIENVEIVPPTNIIHHIQAEKVSVNQTSGENTNTSFSKEHDLLIKLKEKLKYMELLGDEKEELYHNFKKEYDKILDLKDKELVDLRKENQSLRDAVEFFQKELKDIYNS